MDVRHYSSFTVKIHKLITQFEFSLIESGLFKTKVTKFSFCSGMQVPGIQSFIYKRNTTMHYSQISFKLRGIYTHIDEIPWEQKFKNEVKRNFVKLFLIIKNIYYQLLEPPFVHFIIKYICYMTNDWGRGILSS